jgi:uncharacterized protein (TIGR03067 family)
MLDVPPQRRGVAMVARIGILLFAAIASSSISLRVRAEEKKTDAKALQGTWVVTAQMYEGKELDPKEIQKEGIKFVITAEEITIVANGVTRSKSTWTIDAMQTPKYMNLVLIEPTKGEKLLGIYELNGDVLKLCLHPGDKNRPAKFEAKKGSMDVVHILKKEKPK